MARLPYTQYDNRNCDLYDIAGTHNGNSHLVRNAMESQHNSNIRPNISSFNRPVYPNRRGSPFVQSGPQYGNNNGYASNRQSSVDPQYQDLYMRTRALENANMSSQYRNFHEDPRMPSASTSRYPHNGPFVSQAPYGNDYQHRQRPMPYHMQSRQHQYNQQRGGYRGFQGNHMHRNGSQFPNNNSWGVEYEPIVDTQPEEFGSVAIVLWFNGSCGELLCARNLKQSSVHFYFDGRTVFNGEPLALFNKDDPLLKAGAKVEFECFYKHPTEREQSHHFLFHIKNMTCLPGEIRFEESVLAVDTVFGPVSVTSFRTAYDKDLQSVLIHPSIFTKDIIAREIGTGCTSFRMNHNELRAMKSTLTGSRTVTGSVGLAPRWFNDVIGHERILKKFLIFCKPYEEIQEGEATIAKLYYAHETKDECRKAIQILICPVNNPDVLIPFSTLHLDTKIRIRIQLNRRVKFVACREMPGMTYEWRAIDVSLPECEGDMIAPCHISSDYLEEARTDGSHIENHCDLIDFHSSIEEQPLYDDFVNIMPCSSASKSSNEVSYMAELLDLDWSTKPGESLNGSANQVPAVNTASGSSSVTEVDLVDTSETSILDTTFTTSTCTKGGYMRVVGCSPYEELSYETCTLTVDYSDGYKCGDEPHEHKVIDYKGIAKKKALEEKKRKRAKPEEESEESPPEIREDWKPRNTFEKILLDENVRRKETQKVDLVPTTSSSTTGGIVVDVESKRGKSEPVAPCIGADVVSIPDPSICVIGVYDDIGFLIGNRLKMQEERRIIEEAHAEKKRERPRTKIPEPKKPSHDNGFWFRRKDPRLYPTVLVGNFVKRRNRELDAMDIDINLLKKTVVIRDKMCTGVPFVPIECPVEIVDSPLKEIVALPSIADMVPSSKDNVEPCQKKCAAPGPPENKLVDMLKEDKIFGSFFGSLLNSKKNMK